MNYQNLMPLIEMMCAGAPNLGAEMPTDEILKQVDPFIGTGFHGHTFPGATTPFGMVLLSPDTRTSGWDACGGYYDAVTEIWGFSHTHLSGTGIGDYGDVLMMSFSGDVGVLAADTHVPREAQR